MISSRSARAEAGCLCVAGDPMSTTHASEPVRTVQTPSDRCVPGPYRSDAAYTDRASKARYMAAKYAPILRGSVLDVGCDEAPLRRLVGRPDSYVGVDMRADADHCVNLDAVTDGGPILPFASESFDTVVCTDVLEHLERVHAVFDELCRVSKDRIVISLPNPLASLIEAIAGGTGGRVKYYGLPLDPPADRHRWFFGFEEAADFVRERARRNGFAVEQLDVERLGALEKLVKDSPVSGLVASPNARLGTMWCVLRREKA